MKPGRIHLDFETRSAADLSEVGAWNYSRHPSTRALCVAITNEDGNIAVYDLLMHDHWPKEWENAIKQGLEIHAFNCAFEYSIVTNTLAHWPQPHPEMWRDTQAKSLACGFPASVGLTAKALRLPEQKDEAGTSLINYWSKPIASGERKGDFRDCSEDPKRWQEFMDYCRQDVVTQVAIDDALLDLSDDELAFWLATWEQNRNGIYLDMKLVNSLANMIDHGHGAIKKALEESEVDFAYEDLTNHAKVLDHVQGAGADLTSVAKARVKEALSREDLPADARTVLEARQAQGRTSVAKLATMQQMVGDDGRLRFLTRPHGTGTGRDASVGMNIQNMPRGEKMDVDTLVNAALAEDAQAFLNAAKVKGKADPLGGIVTCLRGCFAAPPGKVLHQCDWSAIEPRLGAWFVGDEDMLKAFRHIDANGGVDIYQIEAAKFYGCDPQEIKGERRQFGKVYVLQNQYESGDESIQRAAKDMYGLVLTLDQAKECKDSWRALHPKWTAAWRDVQSAAMMACQSPKKVFAVGRAAFCHDGQHLKMRLPSGRIIWFPWAEIREEDTKFGMRPALTYEFAHHKKWVRGSTHGGALFNVVIQGSGADLMRCAARTLRVRGHQTVLRVHDEMVIESTPDTFASFKKAMLEVPPWAKGLPINGAGWTALRYKKD
jgi:DNA polymerase